VTVLGKRALNRALLARQLLLERDATPVVDAVEHLVGLQAQEPQEPYVGLWSRLDGFDPHKASQLLEERTLVRTLLMRRTLHLVSARDCVTLRPLLQDMLRKRMRSTLGRHLPGVDFDELADAGRPFFEDEPRMIGEVGRLVAERWPDVDPRVLGDALSSLVQLVQVPPRGLWRQSGAARNTTIRVWLGREPEPADDGIADELVLRYLRAFGPAAGADIRAWSGLGGVRAVIDRLRPQLRTFRDERGRELFDVQDAPLPDPGTPAPPRFLPAFDNAVLGFDDRTRIIDDEYRGLSVAGSRVVLVDGRVAAQWTVADGRVKVDPLTRLARGDRAAVGEEADRLGAFLAG
jgi:hypothetical protein